MANLAIFCFLYLVLSLVCLLPFQAIAQHQNSPWSFRLESVSGYSSNDAVPLWIRSNQYGSVPTSGLSSALILAIKKGYQNNNEVPDFSRFDWGFAVESRVNTGAESNITLIESNVKGKWGILEFNVGRRKDVMGLNGDTTLSSGNFAVSGNALGIPKLEIAIPDYYRLPFFDGLISLKGNWAHGWVGKRKIDNRLFLVTSENFRLNTYYHQKSLYGRIGRADGILNLYGGINHQAYWGNEKSIYGDSFPLSTLSSYYYVFWAKPYSNEAIGSSKLGNHLGSIDLAAELKLKDLTIMGYRQNFYDIGAISKLANIADGLNGLSITNRRKAEGGLHWRKVLFEFFYSKHQAGYPWAKATASGDEDYYNNSYYLEGWSYRDRGNGNPFITPAHEAKEGQVSNPRKYFISNRVSALHLGLDFQTYNFQNKIKLSYAQHFGNFSTSKWGASLGKEFQEPYGRFIPVNQFSAYLGTQRTLANQFTVGLQYAIDIGDLLNRSTAAYFTLSKTW